MKAFIEDLATFCFNLSIGVLVACIFDDDEKLYLGLGSFTVLFGIGCFLHFLSSKVLEHGLLEHGKEV